MASYCIGPSTWMFGAKLSVQLINEMRRQNKKYGMVSACIGGGQGIAALLND
ncbi:MAG: hypothetical protein R2807_02805 [Chitinophagales bacterium]